MALATVGLTGGIASGKSTVARRFGLHGIPIVDADEIARDVVRPGMPGLSAIVDTFGDRVLAADGTLDRPALGRRVFEDADARRALEAILHPRIAAESAARFESLSSSSDAPYLLYEAALLVETGRHGDFDALVVVAASVATQLARLLARDGSDEEAARARIASQMPLAEKIAVADYVIWNDGPRGETERRVDEVHAALVERFTGQGAP